MVDARLVETGGPHLIAFHHPNNKLGGQSDHTWFISDSGCNLPHYLTVARNMLRNTRVRSPARSLIAHLMTNMWDLFSFCPMNGLRWVKCPWYLNFVGDVIFCIWSLHMVTRMVLSAEDSPSFLMFCYCGAVDDWNSAGHVIHRNLLC